ncbi:MAG: ATP-binding protein [Bacteroidales bacterium]|nr:ATP-binding protein [Bacteroidales bacterium]
MKNRTLSANILQKSASRFGRIIVLTGARQTGKTTLVRKLFPNHSYISIEDPVLVEEYRKLTASQWNSLYPVAILDEIQKEPKLVESIKAVYDQFSSPRYILLGSSQILLLKNIRESLAGRCLIVELYPLTLPEMLTDKWEDPVTLSYFQSILSGQSKTMIPFLLDNDHAQKKEILDAYLKFGGYPAISDSSIPAEEKYEWLKNYVRTYLERDIRDLAEIRHLEPFTRVQKLLAINTAQLVNFSRMANEAGVSSKTVQRFLLYMSISYQILTLPAWSRNQKKRLVKSPKVHFLDMGVMRTVLQKREELTGHEFESAIVAEIYKQSRVIDQDVSFYHLRTTDGREIDLLIETEKGYIAIEIKKSEHVRSVDARHLRELNEILDKPVLHRFIISNDMNARTIDQNTEAIPAIQFLT